MSTASVTSLVLEELELKCEKIRVDLKKNETRTPEHLKLNPNGKVPLLVHDGTPLWESAAITMYLGELFGVEKGLYPAPGPKRGEAMKWIVWANVTLVEAVVRWAANTQGWWPEEQRNAKAGEAGKADMHGCLKILDSALADRAFLLHEYSLADTHLHSFMDWLRHMNVDFAPYENLNRWGEKCSSRPAYTRLMAQQG